MSEIRITSVKLIKDGEKLEVSYRESGDLQSNVDKVYDNVVHSDLVKAMQGLTVHLAIITDWVPASEAKKPKDLDKIKTNGYHIGGKEGQEGISIVGGRTGLYGYLALNAPFTRLDETGEGAYILIKDLMNKVAAIEAETMLYMNGEKMAQPSMFPEEKETAKKMRIAKPIVDPLMANPEAMERVSKMKNTKAKGGKRVAQSPENKSGIVS